jgi:hypothetical protein
MSVTMLATRFTPLHHALALAEWTWSDLLRSSEQIILFGSRAANLARDDSDWDVLVVGEGQARSRRGLDLVWVSSRELAQRDWLGSELAGHVARWGRWLHGAPNWVSGVRCDAEAADRKVWRVASRLAALERVWDRLEPADRDEYRTLVRRDLQRHALLTCGKVVPPSRALDNAWSVNAAPQEAMLRLAQSAGVCTTFLEAALADSGPAG